MRYIVDAEPRQPARQAQKRPGRSRALWITLGIVVALVLAFTGFASLWSERLWFNSVGYESVFTNLSRTRVGLFLVFGLVMAVVVGINLYLAYRFRPIFRPASCRAGQPRPLSRRRPADPHRPAARCGRSDRRLCGRHGRGQVARVHALAQR